MKVNKRWKLMPILSAILFILAGIWFILDPKEITEILPFVIGTVILFVGIEQIIYSIGTREYTLLPGFRLTQGIISTLLGIVFIMKQDFSLIVLGLILGVWAIIVGSIKLNVALQEKTLQLSWGWDLILGLFQIIFGFILIFHPFAGISTWILVVGVYFIVIGITILLSVYHFDKLLKFE